MAIFWYEFRSRKSERSSLCSRKPENRSNRGKQGREFGLGNYIVLELIQGWNKLESLPDYFLVNLVGERLHNVDDSHL